MSKVHVKSGDTVMVMSGVEKGKIAKVLEVSPKAHPWSHLNAAWDDVGTQRM